jgi:phosphatidylethanolamine/phosphatidyl-N-methylethanolamine N-methyltransferase
VNCLRDNEFYEKGFGGLYATGFIGLLKGIVHKLMEFPFRNSRKEIILEVGAGRGIHLNYVNGIFDKYYMTDIVIDKDLKFNDSSEKLFVIEQDAQNLDFENDIFDRVIATCLIAHLDDPIRALGEWRRVAKDKGDITIYIPCEPGLLLRLFRFIFILPKSLLKGISEFNSSIVLEHRNSYLLVKHSIKMEFNGDEIRLRRYPFPFLSWNFNIFAIASIKINKG